MLKIDQYMAYGLQYSNTSTCMFLLEQVTIEDKGRIAQFSFREWMDKQIAVYIYNGYNIIYP